MLPAMQSGVLGVPPAAPSPCPPSASPLDDPGESLCALMPPARGEHPGAPPASAVSSRSSAAASARAPESPVPLPATHSAALDAPPAAPSPRPSSADSPQPAAPPTWLTRAATLERVVERYTLRDGARPHRVARAAARDAIGGARRAARRALAAPVWRRLAAASRATHAARARGTLQRVVESYHLWVDARLRRATRAAVRHAARHARRVARRAFDAPARRQLAAARRAAHVARARGTLQQVGEAYALHESARPRHAAAMLLRAARRRRAQGGAHGAATSRCHLVAPALSASLRGTLKQVEKVPDLLESAAQQHLPFTFRARRRLARRQCVESSPISAVSTPRPTREGILQQVVQLQDASLDNSKSARAVAQAVPGAAT